MKKRLLFSSILFLQLWFWEINIVETKFTGIVALDINGTSM